MRANLKAITATGVLMLVSGASVGLLSTPSRAQLPKSDPAQNIPAYHAAAPKEALEPTLDPAQFKEPVVQNSYAMAAKVKNVLYQQPCYCFCDKNNGHHSLFDCFATTHASECNTCMAEGIFAYEQTQKGKSPAKIRAAIIQGDWRKVDLTAYKDPVQLH